MSGTVKVEGDMVVFELHGLDEFMAIKRRIEVPLSHVVSVSTERAPWRIGRDWRMGGTGIPGVVKDGRYITDDGYAFFEEHDPDRCVTVTVDGETFKKLVFQVEDKDAVAKTIRDALAARQKQP